MGWVEATSFGNYNRLVHACLAVHGSLPPLFPHFFFFDSQEFSFEDVVGPGLAKALALIEKCFYFGVIQI